jgi:hypothetical protein
MSALLTGADLGEVVTRFDVADGQHLDVIAPGTQNGTQHLADPEMVALMLERLEAAYELVIVETPPLPLAANAVPFVREADGVLAVCRRGVVNRENAALLNQAITGLDAPFLGIAAIGFGPGEPVPSRP